MKNQITIVKAFLVFTYLLFSLEESLGQSEGIKFHQGSWDEVLQEAENQNKFIFVDFYADWCGPCIWMQKNVFPDPELSEYYNSNFVNFQVDAEREEAELVNKMQIEAFPTLAFFDSDGNVLFENVGALDSEGMHAAGERVISYPDLRLNYQADPSNTSKLIAYLEIYRAVNPEEASKLAAGALKSMSEEELVSPDAWFLIANFKADYQSRETIYVIDHADYFYYAYEDFGTYLGELYASIIEAAASDNNPELVKLAAGYEVTVRESIEMLEFSTDYYELDALSQYYLEVGDLDNYFEQLDKISSNYRFDDWAYLVELSVEQAEVFSDDEGKMKKVLAWSVQAQKLMDNYYTNFAVSFNYHMMNEKENALIFARKALELCEDTQICEEIYAFIVEIEGE